MTDLPEYRFPSFTKTKARLEELGIPWAFHQNSAGTVALLVSPFIFWFKNDRLFDVEVVPQ